MDSIILLIKDLREKRFFGSLEIKFEGGRIVLIRKTETIKLAKED